MTGGEGIQEGECGTTCNREMGTIEIGLKVWGAFHDTVVELATTPYQDELADQNQKTSFSPFWIFGVFRISLDDTKFDVKNPGTSCEEGTQCATSAGVALRASHGWLQVFDVHPRSLT